MRPPLLRLRPASLFACLPALCLSVWTYAASAQDAISEAVQPVAEHHDDGGLPQLDVTTFPNQLLWLFITGIVLYILMSRLALPRVQRIMAARDHFVHDNLRQAAALRLQSENAKVDYDLALRQAENDAKEFIIKTNADMQAQHEQAIQTVLKDAALRTQAAEQQIQAEKNRILGQLDDTAGRLADEIMLTVFETKPARL